MTEQNKTGLNGQDSSQNSKVEKNNEIMDVRVFLLSMDHQDDLVSLDTQGNLPLSHVEGLSCTANFHLHANGESALGESSSCSKFVAFQRELIM